MRKSPRYAAAALCGLISYVAIANSLPSSIVMWQGYDDALFIRLGMHIANGEWLGPYDQLTLVKGPIYPIFLAAASMTGVSYSTVQFVFYYASCLYFSTVIGRVTDSPKWVPLLIFASALLCPAAYVSGTVIREFFYGSLTLLLVALWLDLLFINQHPQRKILTALSAGAIFGSYWLTREEGVWIVPFVVIAVLGASASVNGFKAKGVITGAWPSLLAVVIGCASVFGAIGVLNFMHYGRFVTVEMKDSSFQKAMRALQRVGGVYGQPYIPVPRQARLLIYNESPSFAKLRNYLDPPGSQEARSSFCKEITGYSCEDIPGSWFMWGVRDAAAKAGMHNSAAESASYYDAVGSEVEAACKNGRLICTKWDLGLIPHITAGQLANLPGTIMRGFAQLVYWPPPSFERGPSSIETADSADAIEFLNRPYRTPVLNGASHDTSIRILTRKAWTSMLDSTTSIIRILVFGGALSILITLTIYHDAWKTRITVLIGALTSVVLARVVILALVDVSSFPSGYHYRLAAADPLMTASAVLAIFLCTTYLFGRFGKAGARHELLLRSHHGLRCIGHVLRKILIR
jgi:hypothetical protein